MNIIDTLAAHIRKVDGNHTMGAGRLAESITETFAVIEAPKPNDTEVTADETATMWSGPHEPYGCAVVEAPGCAPGISLLFPEWITDPSDARELAAILIAAANFAEGVTGES